MDGAAAAGAATGVVVAPDAVVSAVSAAVAVGAADVEGSCARG